MDVLGLDFNVKLYQSEIVIWHNLHSSISQVDKDVKSCIMKPLLLSKDAISLQFYDLRICGMKMWNRRKDRFSWYSLNVCRGDNGMVDNKV